MSDASSVAALVSAFAASIDAPTERIAYCVARVTPIITKERWVPDGRTTEMAARVMGANREHAHLLLTKAHHRGAEATANLHIEKANFFGDYKVGPLDRSVIGWVYHARSVHFPHVVKIGFSLNPATRIKKVASIYGEPLVLESVAVGTKLDEHQELKARWRDNCAHEWFFDPAMECVDIPPFLQPQNIAVKIEGRRKHVAHRQEFLGRFREREARAALT